MFVFWSFCAIIFVGCAGGSYLLLKVRLFWIFFGL